MHKADAIATNIFCFEGSCKELIVSLVDGVAALECQNINTLGQASSDLLRGSAWKNATRQF